MSATQAYATQSVDNYEPVVKEAVQEFMGLFTAKSSPTIKDYQTFFGYSDFEELAFRWQDCVKRGMQAPLKNPECYHEFVDAFVAKDKTPSQLFVWLKKQIPVGVAHQITAIEPTDADVGSIAQITGRNISVTAGDKRLRFWQPADSGQYASYGKLVLLQINGVPLSVLIGRDAQNSVLSALGMTLILRPLTESDREQLNAKIEARCNADPSCSERRRKAGMKPMSHMNEPKLSSTLPSVRGANEK